MTTMIVGYSEYKDMVQAQYSARPGGHADFYNYVYTLAGEEWLDFDAMQVGYADGNVEGFCKSEFDEISDMDAKRAKRSLDTLLEALDFMRERASHRMFDARYGRDETGRRTFERLRDQYTRLRTALLDAELEVV